MLDIRAIRDDPEPFRRGLARRNLAEAVDALLAADERRRALTLQVEELRAEQNRSGKEIGRAQGPEREERIAAVAEVSRRLGELEPELESAEAELTRLLAETPNLPHASAPDGFTDEDAVEVRRHGEPRAFDFPPKDHVALCEALDLADFE
ncbi:MAG: serine--tRNA ligase, partial [Actinomycetota bacterium]